MHIEIGMLVWDKVTQANVRVIARSVEDVDGEDWTFWQVDAKETEHGDWRSDYELEPAKD